MPLPDALLLTHRSVGATSYQVTMPLRLPNHFHGDISGWIPHFKGSINVKANQDRQFVLFL